MNSQNLANIGSKVRRERRSKGFTQTDLSKKIGISASYLNLIESGRRTITVPLLIKIGNELGLSLKDLTVETNKRLLSDIMEALSNEMFGDFDITNLEVTEFISSNTNIAKALLILNDNYKSLSEDMQSRFEKIDVESIKQENKSTRLPVEVVSDFIQENKNYYPGLEEKAESIREKIYFEEGHRTIGHTLIHYLSDHHDTKVKVVNPEDADKSVKKYDHKKKTLFVSGMLNYSSRNFHLAYHIAFLEGEEEIDNIINNHKISSPDVINL